METPDSDQELAPQGSPSVDDACRHAEGSRRTGSLPPPNPDDGMGRGSTTDTARSTPRRATAGTRSGVSTGSPAGYLTDGDQGFAKGRRTDHNGGDDQVAGQRFESPAAHFPPSDTDVLLTRSGKHQSADSSASDDSLRAVQLKGLYHTSTSPRRRLNSNTCVRS